MSNSDNIPHRITAVAFDLDGTLYVGDTIVEGAADLVQFIRQEGMQVFFFTNASTRTRRQIFEKLAGMGLNPSLDRIYSSAYAVAVYLSKNSISRVSCLGTQGLKEELVSAGIHVSLDPLEAEALVVGLDPEFSYARLADIMPFADRVCPIIACNRDSSFPVGNGRRMPGCGPGVAAVEDALGRRVDFVAGKPNTYMMELLETNWGLCCNDILVVGDSLESDIEMAEVHGCRSVLISRESRLDAATGRSVVVPDISYIKPHIVSLRNSAI